MRWWLSFFYGSRPWRSDYERVRRRALAIAKPTSEGLLTKPDHDQPDHEGLFPTSKQRRSKKRRLESRYCEYKMKTLLIKAGFYDAFVWSLNTNEVHEVAAMANINLNKTQSLNDALRAVYLEEEGEISWPLEERSETNPISCFPTHTDSKNSLYLSISKIHGPGPKIRWRNT